MELSRNIFFHKFVGGNFRLDPIQAAVLLVNLPLLEKWSAARRRNAVYYNAHFQDSRVGTPFIRPDCISIYNQYVIRVQEQDGLAAHLKEYRIGTEIYYPRPCTSRNALRIWATAREIARTLPPPLPKRSPCRSTPN